MFVGMSVLSAAAASAQVTPAAGFTPPDDTPVIKVGATIFTDYTYTKEPQSKDADGNSINPSAFNVSRSYINITGNVSHVVNFRITPDVTRVTDSSGALSGNLVLRLNYAFAQINLDDWMTRGSWVRFGLQQTLQRRQVILQVSHTLSLQHHSQFIQRQGPLSRHEHL